MNQRHVMALGLFLMSAPAWAARPAEHLAENQGLIAADGAALRVERSVSWATPQDQAAAWTRFLIRNGQRWRAQWDADLGIPSRIYGQGVPTPGALKDADLAREHTLGFLSDNLELLAPGASLADFELVSNVLDPQSGIRTLGLLQRHRGLPVVGGQLNVRIKNDRLFVIGTEARPHVDAQLPEKTIDAPAATRAALQWILEDFGGQATVRPELEGPMVLPLIEQAKGVRYATVVRATVDAQAPVGRYHVYLDAQTGAKIAREQTLRFITGTVLFNTPERRPGSTRNDNPASFVRLDVGGQQLFADGAGVINEPGNQPLNATVQPRGEEVVVINDAGQRASNQVTLNDGDTFVWNASGEELIDSQLVTYVAGNVVKEYAKAIAPKHGLALSGRAAGDGEHQQLLQRLLGRHHDQLLPREQPVRKHRAAAGRDPPRVWAQLPRSRDHPRRGLL